jgi:membrane associated rhomboid family serine protease
VIPIRDDNPISRTAWITLAIVALNVVAFLIWEPTFATGQQGAVKQEVFFFCHALVPWEVIHHTNLAQGGEAARQAIAAANIGDPGQVQAVLAATCPHKNWLFSIFTAMFLHAGWLHIGGNMLFLWIFGNNVEDKIKSIPYFFFYIASGLAATVVQVALIHTGANAALPNLGASGAIAGVLGAYLFMFPRRRVLILVFFFLITFVYLPAWVVLGLWFVLQAFNGVAALSSRVNVGGGVAVWAHVGGFVFGSLMALLFFPKERFGAIPPPRRPDMRGGWTPWGRRSRPPPPDGYF